MMMHVVTRMQSDSQSDQEAEKMDIGMTSEEMVPPCFPLQKKKFDEIFDHKDVKISLAARMVCKIILCSNNKWMLTEVDQLVRMAVTQQVQ